MEKTDNKNQNDTQKKTTEEKENYEGTIHDFLLDRAASNLPVELVQAQYKKIWRGDITEEEINTILRGVPDFREQIIERKKKIATQIRESNYINMTMQIIENLYTQSKNTKNARDLTVLLTTLNSYLQFFMKKTEVHEIDIKTTATPEEFISFLLPKQNQDKNETKQESIEGSCEKVEKV
jgi:hypothetical protein